MQSNALTSHEFYAEYPNAKAFETMNAARAWQDQNGGHIWHMGRNGMVRPGAPLAGTLQVFVAQAWA